MADIFTLEKQIKLMIDELKGLSATNGLANQASEEVVITSVFLYKFLNETHSSTPIRRTLLSNMKTRLNTLLTAYLPTLSIKSSTTRWSESPTIRRTKNSPFSRQRARGSRCLPESPRMWRAPSGTTLQKTSSVSSARSASISPTHSKATLISTALSLNI